MTKKKNAGTVRLKEATVESLERMNVALADEVERLRGVITNRDEAIAQFRVHIFRLENQIEVIRAALAVEHTHTVREG